MRQHQPIGYRGQIARTRRTRDPDNPIWRRRMLHLAYYEWITSRGCRRQKQKRPPIPWISALDREILPVGSRAPDRPIRPVVFAVGGSRGHGFFSAALPARRLIHGGESGSRQATHSPACSEACSSVPSCSCKASRVGGFWRPVFHGVAGP